MWETLKQHWKSRTVRYSIVVGLLEGVQAYIIPLEYQTLTRVISGIAVSIGIWYFRSITTVPIGEK